MKTLLKKQQNRILIYMLITSLIFITGIIQENILIYTTKKEVTLCASLSTNKTSKTQEIKNKQKSLAIRKRLLKKGIQPKEAVYWKKD